MKLLINKSKITTILLMAITMLLAQNSYAGSSDVRYGLSSKYVIKGDDLIQIKRRGRMNLKRAIKRKLFDKLPANAKLNSVTVWAKAVGPENVLDLEVGQEISDHDSIKWYPPVCKMVDVTKTVTRRDGTTKEITRPKKVCTESTPQVTKVVLNSYGSGDDKAWVLNTDVDIEVVKVEVDTTVPGSYETNRVYLGSGKADKLISSSKRFSISGQVDSVAVTASKHSITLTGVVVHFSDGTSQDVPNVRTKVTKNSSAVVIEVGMPFKHATSVTVYAESRKLIGSRGRMNVSVDYITTSID